jgi:hypothetical protein
MPDSMGKGRIMAVIGIVNVKTSAGWRHQVLPKITAAPRYQDALLVCKLLFSKLLLNLLLNHLLYPAKQKLMCCMPQYKG